MIAINQPLYSGARKQLIMGVAGFVLTCHVLLANNLLNIDFGVGASSQKQGPAAFGNSPTDFWNHYSRDDGSGGFRTDGEVFDLVWSDGNVSTADLTVVNAPGAWGNQSPDPMFGIYLYPGSGENIVVSIRDLPVGSYALYVYAHGALDGENGDVQVRVGDFDHGAKVTNVTADWQSLPWQEGVQYVRYQSLTVSANEPLVITVRPGTTGLAVINGMQLLRQTDCAPPSGLVGWWPGEGDGTEVAGGNDGELVNGLDFASGLVGQAFNFDAPGEHLVTPTLDNFAADSFTLETWINPDPAQLAEQQPIFEFADETGSAGAHFWLSVVDGGGNASEGALFGNVRSVTGENHLLGTPPGRVVGGEWSHVAMTYDSASGIGSLYLNGILEVSRELGSFEPQTGLPLQIGYRPQDSAEGGGGFTFGGKIDEPSFYARALLAEEIAAIHAAGSNGKCLPAPCVLIPSDALGWWPGEGDGADALGNSDGELQNGLEFSEGLVGQAFLFDAPGEHLLIPAAGSFAPHSFTLEAWVNPDPARLAEQLPVFEFAETTGLAGVHLWLSVLDGGGYASEGALFGNVRSLTREHRLLGTPAGRIVGGEWSHVALTYDAASGVGSLYLNGVLEVSRELGIFEPRTGQPLHIGYRPQNSAEGAAGSTFGGKIDEPSFYARALSAEEIATIHAGGSAGKCLPMGYYLTVGSTVGGIVQRDPDAAGYQAGEIVTLTALPAAGFAFDHWQGDVSGTEPEVALLMDGSKQVRAIFVDVAPPEIVIESPVPGIAEESEFVLSGSVTDNLGVRSASWEWNGQRFGFLPLTAGQFYIEGLQWALGENRIRVVAVDIAGNEASSEVVVEWVPARSLSVVDPEPRQEGQRIRVPIQLTSSGDVGGASFVLRYNPAYLKQPSLDWSGSVLSALNQVNTDIPGEVRATFALPATAVPAGTRNLAVVTFRARSVPGTLTTPLLLQLLDVSDPSGNSMVSGTAVRSGQATILVRRVVGDNNANDRWDVGDATLMQRLLTGIDPVRFWDRTGNDVNENTLLDSGDVIRVLRAVVGLDPQPLPNGGVSASISHPRQGLTPMNSETAGAIILEADKLRAAPGELVTLRVRFAEVSSPIAGLALNLEYPVEALRLLNSQSHRVGDLVPATTVAVWNVAPAQNDYTLQSGAVSLAMSSALSWPLTDGVVAEFTFQVQEGQTARHQWPIHVSQVELSADGYDMAALPDATVFFVGRDPFQPWLTPIPSRGAMNEEGFALSFQGETGFSYLLEMSTDLSEWTLLGNYVGADELITVRDPEAFGAEHRFYRVRLE